ncbi:MAG: hypothetical protein ACI4C3_00265 [Bacteroides sp.]
MMKKKEHYVSPSIEVVAMENEGVIAASNEPMNPVESSAFKPGASSAWGASSNDLESMIEDIFTFEN